MLFTSVLKTMLFFGKWVLINSSLNGFFLFFELLINVLIISFTHTLLFAHPFSCLCLFLCIVTGFVLFRMLVFQTK